jgi:hypothetical protein
LFVVGVRRVARTMVFPSSDIKKSLSIIREIRTQNSKANNWCQKDTNHESHAILTTWHILTCEACHFSFATLYQ